MSVFTFDTRPDNPVTTAELGRVCDALGVTVTDAEKEDYRRLLAVFHEAAEGLLALPEYMLPVDLERYQRTDVHAPEPAESPLRAWAHRCVIRDTHAQEYPGQGVLAGRTVAFKDCVAIAGVPMTAGSAVYEKHVPSIDATVVTRVLQAGGTVTGVAVCENLCDSGTSHSAATGVVHNPYARGYSTGGSSSGCGALVSSGAVDMAIGADQGASIRLPASWCGICGLKPTFGLVPYTGIGSNEPTNDHTGPMARGVLDNARLMEAVAGSDGIDDRSFAAPSPEAVPDYAGRLLAQPDPKNLAGVRIGIIAESLDRPAMDPRILRTFAAAMDGFRALGAVVEEVSIPLHVHGPAIWTAISKIGGAATKLGPDFGRRGYVMTKLAEPFNPLTQDAWEKLYPSSKNILLNGVYAQKTFPSLLGRATNLSLRLRREYDAALARYTVLATPTAPYVANSHAAVAFADSSPEAPATPLDLIGKQLGLTSNTAPFDQSGHPALAMPCGRLPIVEGPLAGSGVKLPVGMQLVGRWFGEEDVYRVAYAWELANKWEEL